MCQGAAQVGKAIMLIFAEILSLRGLDNQVQVKIRVMRSKSAYFPNAGQWAGFDIAPPTPSICSVSLKKSIFFYRGKTPFSSSPERHQHGFVRSVQEGHSGPKLTTCYKVQDAKSLGHSPAS